ncbi:MULTISPECIES: hypothetical protein [Thalassospira]|uniref:Solute-binding protein family 3/N-terminal domain-containing protein n=2 Tax=Thalassospira TaxID=168934 RepID=A0A367WBH4_9PROT|nr:MULTISPECIES: hypothetical protein [Thalassospira]MDG4717735.1 hypothetical protein [Thalassospira sp. FZY0004]RCK38805.1 hypothetical protein TH19_03095 [Thalassospira profundimaris]
MRFRPVILIIAASFAVFGMVSGAHATEQNRTIRIPVKQADMDGLDACIRSGSEDCRKCRQANQSNLSLMQYTLLREALAAGGFDATVEPVLSPNSERSRKMIEAGQADVKTDWIFNIATDDSTLRTEPLFLTGEIEKGLYARRDFIDADRQIGLADIKTMRAVGIRNWRLDWQVLESLSPATLSSAATTIQVFAVIDAGRADFTLLEFSSQEDMGREVDGIRLYPIPNVKISLPATQHFMVSARLENADKVVDALNRGIRTLRESGFIQRCLVNSGVINPAVAYWQTLNSMTETIRAEPATVSTQ